MKVDFKNSLLNNMPLEHRGKLKQNKAEIDAEQNYNKERPAKAISFSGSAISLGQKFVESKAINTLADYVKKNEAGFIAFLVLILSGIIKPIMVLNSKGSDEKDKQLIATKNLIQAFIGFIMGKTIGGGIVNKAVGKIQDNIKLISVDEHGNLSYAKSTDHNVQDIAKKLVINEHTTIKDRFKNAKAQASDKSGLEKAITFIKTFATKPTYKPTAQEITDKADKVVKEFAAKHKKIFEANPDFIKKVASKALPEIRRKGSTTTLYEAFESFWKNSTGWITAILKAKVTSVLLPTVTAFLFANRAIKALKENNKDSSPLLNNNEFKKENEKYKVALSKTSTPINFTGKFTQAISDALAVGVEKLSMTKFGENAVTTLARFKKPSPRMADLESFIITTYWLQNTARSKKIEPDQKLGLNIQTALVTAVAFISSLTADKLLDKPMRNVKEIFRNTLTKNVNTVKEEVNNGTIKHTREAIEEATKIACKKLAGSDEIAKQISRIDINNDTALKQAINDLTNSYDKKVGKLKSLATFTLIVRFLVPILMVPVGGKLKNKIKEWQKKNEEAKNQEVKNS